MKYPFDSFMSQEAGSVPYGKFYLLNGDWLMSVDANQGNAGAASGVFFTGENTGDFTASLFGPALYVADGYKVVQLIDPDLPIDKQKNAGALMLASKPLICCYKSEVPHAVTMEGVLVKLHDFPPHRFQEWSGWLAKEDGTLLGESPLFKVRTMK